MSQNLDLKNQARINDTNLKVENNALAELKWQDYRTANTSVLREYCLVIGGFDETLVAAEDTEFSSRLAQASNMRYYYVDDIEVVHHHPISRDEYFAKGKQYGEAVAGWYAKTPELRKQIILRYGVFAPETTIVKKFKYVIRGVIVNRFTIHMISYYGEKLRSSWFEMSEIFYRCVFRYRLRSAFRNSIARKLAH